MLRRTFLKSIAATVMLALGEKYGLLEKVLAPAADPLEGVIKSELTLEYGVAEIIYQIDPKDTPLFQMVDEPFWPITVSDDFAKWLGVPKAWLRLARERPAMRRYLNGLLEERWNLGQSPPPTGQVQLDQDELRKAWLKPHSEEGIRHRWQKSTVPWYRRSDSGGHGND